MEEKLVAKQTRADGCICRLETSNLFPCCFPCQTTVAARTHLFRISQYPSVAKHVDVTFILDGLLYHPIFTFTSELSHTHDLHPSQTKHAVNLQEMRRARNDCVSLCST